MLSNSGRRSVIGGGVLLVGAALLIASFFLSWYTIAVSGHLGGRNLSSTVDFHPGSTYTIGSGAYTLSGTYTEGHLNNTGNLFALVEALLLSGLVLGGLGGVLGIVGGWQPRYTRAAPVLGALAMLLALIGPIVAALGQPRALKNDLFGQASFGGTSNPTTSFYGSVGTPVASVTWGPAIGWFLSLAAGVLLLAGVVLVAWAGRAEARAQAAGVGAPGSEAAYAAPMGEYGGSADSPAGGSDVASSGPSYRCTPCQRQFARMAEYQEHLRAIHRSELSHP